MSEPAEPGGATAGELLRAARDKRGMHLAVLAAGLKVSPRKLEMLEANRYDELPDATFVRALALSMCRALKIDPEPVLARLPQPASHGLEQVARGLNQPFRDREVRREPGEWGRSISLPVVGALLLILAALAVLFWPKGERAAEGAVAASAPSSVTASAPVAMPAAAASAVEAVAAPAAPASPAGAVVETVFSAPTSASGAASPLGSLLTLRATGDSWVEVIDAGGQVLLSRTLASGETLGLDGSLPLRVTVGNADVTEVGFRGKPVPLAALTRDNVARLELK
jgi:cytoskeleton protein RodZ